MNITEITRKLQDLGVNLPCSRCGNTSFTVIDGFGNFLLQKDTPSQAIVIGGPTIPVIFVACNKCGAITPHALGALQSLEQTKSENK